jgi:hypothetical protein
VDSIPYSRDIPVVQETGVLVVGGGIAGIGAAVGAARHGAHTTLIEQSGCLGGTATNGLVATMMTSFDSQGKHQVIRGIFEELLQRMMALNGAIHPSQIRPDTGHAPYTVHAHLNDTPFDSETMKYVADQMVEEAGVHMIYHTYMVDVIKEDNAIRGVIVANKSGLQAIRAKVVIDCTGDGDVAYLAGAPMAKGRPSDGRMQPMTMYFRMGGIDGGALLEYKRLHPTERHFFGSILAEQRAKGYQLSVPRDNLGILKGIRPGEYRFNSSRLLGYDGTDADSLTSAEIEGRKQVWELAHFSRTYCPGMQNSYIIDTASYVGIRETRRIVGDYVLTVDDVIAATPFPDVIAMCGFYIDIHNPDGPGQVHRETKTAPEYGIPYRSLLPQQVEQLLVAGRCISADHIALGAVRVMPPACATGEAAGIAAALAIRDGVPPRRAPIGDLQHQLLAGGAYLGERFTEAIAHEAPIPGS